MTISEIVFNVRTMGIDDKKNDLEKKEKYVCGIPDSKKVVICYCNTKLKKRYYITDDKTGHQPQPEQTVD